MLKEEHIYRKSEFTGNGLNVCWTGVTLPGLCELSPTAILSCRLQLCVRSSGSKFSGSCNSCLEHYVQVEGKREGESEGEGKGESEYLELIHEEVKSKI